MITERKLHMFLIFLTSVLLSVMLVLMRLGGSVNFDEFMSAKRVYDVNPSSLQKSSKGWLYDEGKKGYLLLNDKAGIRFLPGEKARSWSFIYLTVGQLSRESVEGMLRIYDAQKQRIHEQPIQLIQGRNMIQLDDIVTATPISAVRIVILDAQGEFISISELQFRTTPSWFTMPHFLRLFAVAMTGSLVVLIIFTVIYRLCRAWSHSKDVEENGRITGALQDGMCVIGDFLGGKMGGRLYSHQRESVRKFLFSLLFVWMILGNVAGWLHDADVFRYHVLVCALLLLIISFVSWEKPLQNRIWKGTFIRSWLFLWIGIILCDFFVDGKMESLTGYVMLTVGSIFIFFWQNMEKPDRMLHDLMDALEFTFFLGIVYCMMFRMKRPAIDYNGVFKSPEELSMYGVLMGIVFLTDLDWLIDRRVAAADDPEGDYQNEGVFSSCVKNIVGGAAALFFVLRSGHTPGIVIFALLGILYIPRMIRNIPRMAKKCRILFLDITVALFLAGICVYVIFISTKYFPHILGMDVKYEDELQLTELQGEERRLYLEQYPKSLSGTRKKDPAKLPVLWRNYARRLNLFGHSGRLKVFDQKNLPYSGYLNMAYYHGLFILLPYVAFQISVIVLGLRYVLRKDSRKNVYILFLGIAYLGFSFIANVEIPWGHPLWLCFYLLPGYSKVTGKNTGKEEVV